MKGEYGDSKVCTSMGTFRQLGRAWGIFCLTMERVLEAGDLFCCILAFLSPADVESLSRTCRSLHRICSDGSKLWGLMCERRWGGSTDVKRWGQGRVPFRLLYALLDKLEGLVGMWRGVGGPLVAFEWSKQCILGYRVAPSNRGSFKVRKIPFVWIGASSRGDRICVLRDLEEGYDPGDPFAQMDSEWDVDKLAGLGLVLVDVNFAGKDHIVVEEIKCCCSYKHDRRKVSLAEAVASASFGFSARGLDAGLKPGTSGGGESSCRSSPPGSFPYEMYQFLASKVTSPGSGRAAWKQRQRHKVRAESQGKRFLEQEHLLKVVNCYPTKERPLQGLWKGLCHCSSLDFILLSYDENGMIRCRSLGGNHSSGGPVHWTLTSMVHAASPLDDASFRIHPAAESNGHRDGFPAIRSELPGRIWVHDSGSFAFGSPSKLIDFRLVCSRGSLLDVDAE